MEMILVWRVIRIQIAVRKDNPALRLGRFRKLQAESLFCAFERRTDENRCIVAINQGHHDRTLQLPSLPGADLLGGQPIENNQISVPVHRAAIVRFATLTATAPAIPDASVEPEPLDIDFVSGHAV
jgi:hypothetical protein